MSKIIVSKTERNEEESFQKKTGVNFRTTQLAHSLGSKIRKVAEDSAKSDITSPEMTQELGLDVIANFGLDNVSMTNYDM